MTLKDTIMNFKHLIKDWSEYQKVEKSLKVFSMRTNLNEVGDHRRLPLPQFPQTTRAFSLRKRTECTISGWEGYSS